MYDPAVEKVWEQKYKFFSGPHMRQNYRTFARARHDPFNKDPSWGKAVIANIAGVCASQGSAPNDVFKEQDISGNQSLSRPDMKKALCGVMPALSDLEIAAAFDVVDVDRSGVVNVNDFCNALSQSKRSKIPLEAAARWRNPLHRINRVAPALPEGWDHLEGQPSAGDGLNKHSESQTNELVGRLGDTLANTPRALRHTIMDSAPKHQYFGGGADCARFERQNWLRGRSTPRGGRWTPRFPDPGPDLRPGFLVEAARGRQPLTARGGFSSLTPQQANLTA